MKDNLTVRTINSFNQRKQKHYNSIKCHSKCTKQLQKGCQAKKAYRNNLKVASLLFIYCGSMAYEFLQNNIPKLYHP